MSAVHRCLSCGMRVESCCTLCLFCRKDNGPETRPSRPLHQRQDARRCLRCVESEDMSFENIVKLCEERP